MEVVVDLYRYRLPHVVGVHAATLENPLSLQRWPEAGVCAHVCVVCVCVCVMDMDMDMDMVNGVRCVYFIYQRGGVHTLYMLF